jgi:hypothetical protein
MKLEYVKSEIGKILIFTTIVQNLKARPKVEAFYVLKQRK